MRLDSDARHGAAAPCEGGCTGAAPPRVPHGDCARPRARMAARRVRRAAPSSGAPGKFVACLAPRRARARAPASRPPRGRTAAQARARHPQRPRRDPCTRGGVVACMYARQDRGMHRGPPRERERALSLSLRCGAVQGRLWESLQPDAIASRVKGAGLALGGADAMHAMRAARCPRATAAHAAGSRLPGASCHCMGRSLTLLRGPAAGP